MNDATPQADHWHSGPTFALIVGILLATQPDWAADQRSPAIKETIDAIARKCSGNGDCLRERVVHELPAGAVLQRVDSPDTDTIRWVDTRRSVGLVTDLDDGTRLIVLDRFGRKVLRELADALPAQGAVILDLRANAGGDFGRMLQVAGRFTGAVVVAVTLTGEDTRRLSIPAANGNTWRGSLTVLVGPQTASSAEVLAALLRQHAGARVLGERTRGKDYLLRIVPIDQNWRVTLPGEVIGVPGESLVRGLRPDGPIPSDLYLQITAALRPQP